MIFSCQGDETRLTKETENEAGGEQEKVGTQKPNEESVSGRSCSCAAAGLSKESTERGEH